MSDDEIPEIAKSSDKELERYPQTIPDPRALHRVIDRMDQSWPVLKPIIAVVTNWKAWSVGLAIYAFLRREEILMLLDAVAGVK